MRVHCTYTLNELKKITPSLTREHFFMECPKVKEALKELFWRLGCTVGNKWEITEGVVSRNRFNEIDDSMRILVYERLDRAYLQSKWASNAAKLATNDVEMMRMIDQHRNQRSFNMEEY